MDGEFLTGLISAVVAFLVAWFTKRNPTPEPVPVNPALPAPLPTPTPIDDPFAPLPGLPGHPFLNGLVKLLPLLKILLGGLAIAQTAKEVRMFSAGNGLQLSTEDKQAIGLLAVALKSCPAAQAEMISQLE